MQPCLRYTIDQLFQEKSRRIILFQFNVYGFFFVIPFITQIFLKSDTWINICMFICMATQIFFFSIEVLQMRNDGFKEYISDNMNKTDILMLAAFVCYFVLRMGYSFDGSNVIIPSIVEIKNHEAMTPDWFALMVLNVAITVQIVIKICFFCKVNDKFGMLVQLVLTCIQDV